MSKSIVFRIIGILIVLFWFFMLVELVKRTYHSSIEGEFAHINEEENFDRGSEQWMDIFIRDRKVGYTHTRVKRVNEKIEVRERIFLIVNLMGATRRILSSTRAEVDERFLLENFDFSLSSELINFKISGQIEGNNLFLSMGEKETGETRLIRLPSRPMINAGMTLFFRAHQLKEGNSFRFPLFDPVSMTTNPAIVKVVGKEAIELNGETYNAFRLEMSFLGRPLVFWLDEKGRSLKEEGFMGFTLVKSSPSKALAGLESLKKIDFYELFAITAEKEIEGPRALSYLEVQLNQIPSSLPVDGVRQVLDGKILKIIKESPPYEASYLIPYQGTDKELIENLEPEVLVQSKDEQIISAANKIVKGTTEPLKAATMILGWVFENVEKMPLISIPDAKEILTQRKGDCNEHATLLTALLRAVGIPARIVVGLVYKDGKFYYHAWNEAYICRWISMDATLNQMPADATHIKLINGGIEKQIQIIGMIGNLRLTVLDYR